MVMLIKCLHRTAALVLAIGWIVRGVECIKNGGVVEHQQDVVDGFFDDAVVTTSSSSGQVDEGRQARNFNFFPTERNDFNRQYDFREPAESNPHPKSFDEPSFKFSNDHRPNIISYDTKRAPYRRPSYNNVEGNLNADASVVYGKYYDNYDVIGSNEPPRPPSTYNRRPQYHRETPDLNRPNPLYAQNYNYISNDNKPQRYPNNPSQGRPPQGRPPPSRQPPQYYQTNYRPPNPTYQSAINQPPNYAANYNNYQKQPQAQQYPSGTLSITDFISNLGQSATDLFNGGGRRPEPQHPQYASNKPALQQEQYQPTSQGGSGTASNPVGMFATAIEAITRHDDLQCIPKIICQMVGKQRNQNSLSPVLGSPVFSSLISAVPSTSAGLVYGRAALLGYTAGENRCEGAYPKCPRNEDNLLYYLNNHRGGFFRFFNQPQYQQQQQLYQQQHAQQSYQQQQQQQQQQQSYQQQQDATSTNLAFLTGLADVINQSGGINLSNLGANAGALGTIASFVGGMTGLGGGGGTSAVSNEATGGFNVGQVFSNLLTGFVGNRFASRRISKRSVDAPSADSIDDSELDPVKIAEIDLKYVKKSSSKKRNLNTEMETVTEIEPKRKDDIKLDGSHLKDTEILEDKEEIFAEDEEEIDAVKGDKFDTQNLTNSTQPKGLDVHDDVEGRIINEPVEDLPDHPQGRIINQKRPVFKSNIVHFPSPNAIRHEKMIQFIDIQHLNPAPYAQNDLLFFQSNDILNQPPHQLNEAFRFPLIASTNRGSKRIKFEHKAEPSQNDGLYQSFNIPGDRIKMVFPDRTGTGNLRFDNQDFDVKPVRFGRILSGIGQQNVNNGHSDYTNNNYQVSFNGNRNDNIDSQYQQQLYNYQSSGSNVGNQNLNSQYIDYNKRNENLHYISNAQSTYQPSSSHKTYSNNAASDPNNVYVTNAQGVVEYYINAGGTKVYL